MGPIPIILSILFIGVCIALDIVILLQKDRATGWSGNFSGSTDTYWSKNKGRSVEGGLERYTKLGAVVFVVFAFVILLVF